jgi:hypothetical protein
MLVSGVPYVDLLASVKTWTGEKYRPKSIVRVYHAWCGLHYLLTQTKDKAKHAADVLSYTPDLIYPPFESPNLEGIRRWFADILRSRRRRSRRSAAQRSAQGRKAALTRWRRDR